jgi:hypothetical protein
VTSGLRGVFRRNVAEVASDPVLRVYGSLLALVHVLTFVHWQRGATLRRILSAEGMPICWPFFEDCHRFRVLGPAGVDVLLWGYFAVAVAAMLLFTRRWTVPAGYVVLLALELAKALIIAQDYRLRLNQHYMAFFVAFAFLLFPAKRRALQYLIILFYFWAGTLKLNPEWLSGASLYRREFLWLPAALVPAACAYVVVLEAILVFGLLARRSWVFWATLAQLAVFHVMSWPIVGFFYPSLMFLLLAIFPLSRLFSAESERPSFARIEGRLEPRSTYALLAGFSLLQLVPYAFPGDSALTGQGRPFALHMFDALVVCESHVTLHDGQGGTRRVRVETGRGSARVRCDPIVHWNVARALCRQGAAHGRWTDLDLSLRSRRTTEEALRPIVEVERFCRANPSYDLWRPNPWIGRG